MLAFSRYLTLDATRSCTQAWTHAVISASSVQRGLGLHHATISVHLLSSVCRDASPLARQFLPYARARNVKPPHPRRFRTSRALPDSISPLSASSARDKLREPPSLSFCPRELLQWTVSVAAYTNGSHQPTDVFFGVQFSHRCTCSTKCIPRPSRPTRCFLLMLCFWWLFIYLSVI